MYAVVDCNNFFVSCERVFKPELKNRPVAVLSNNDGCIVSRSNEVKKLGIPMGAPVFKWRDEIHKHGVTLFSANFPLYGDMSRRVMQTLAYFVNDIEIYSIDEAFLDLSEIRAEDLENFGRFLRTEIERWTSIPVSIGIAPTKTLAKAASQIAKKNPHFLGALSTTNPEFEDYFNSLDVGDIWGVGRNYTKFLKMRGINTAGALRKLDRQWVKKNLNVMGERMLLELNGTRCFGFYAQHDPRKAIISSRSFGKAVGALSDLEEAVFSFVSSAAERLRSDRSLASVVQVYIRTNKHATEELQYRNFAIYNLKQATDYTPDLISAAKHALRQIFKPGYFYKKAGVVLMGISPNTQIQLSLFNPYKDNSRDKKLMQAVDLINRNWNRNAIKYAASGIRKRWKPNRNFVSARFTTEWAELPVVKAG